MHHAFRLAQLQIRVEGVPSLLLTYTVAACVPSLWQIRRISPVALLRA